jgi:spheroidene monooxygenase
MLMRRAINTVTLSFYRFASWPARFWVLGQMGLARLSLARMPEIGFWKLCGSGTGQGFTPRPNTAVWAILATWPDPETARRTIDRAPVFRRWQAHATESWTVMLEPTATRGTWSGKQPFIAADIPADTPTGAQTDTPDTGPIVALTRATMRATTALRFWRRVPDISTAIGEDPNVIFKIGIGEVPLLHQVTFSIWPDAASMAHFARGDGPHGRAIRAVRAEGWFTEELYARFRILDHWGTWDGTTPLAIKDAA